MNCPLGEEDKASTDIGFVKRGGDGDRRTQLPES
jgi:hypothetical protein